jgi:hypothetical protein
VLVTDRDKYFSLAQYRINKKSKIFPIKNSRGGRATTFSLKFFHVLKFPSWGQCYKTFLVRYLQIYVINLPLLALGDLFIFVFTWFHFVSFKHEQHCKCLVQSGSTKTKKKECKTLFCLSFSTSGLDF